jgi:hypothetical protein
LGNFYGLVVVSYGEQVANLAFHLGFWVFFRIWEYCSVIIYEIIFHNEKVIKTFVEPL